MSVLGYLLVSHTTIVYLNLLNQIIQTKCSFVMINNVTTFGLQITLNVLLFTFYLHNKMRGCIAPSRVGVVLLQKRVMFTSCLHRLVPVSYDSCREEEQFL